MIVIKEQIVRRKKRRRTLRTPPPTGNHSFVLFHFVATLGYFGVDGSVPWTVITAGNKIPQYIYNMFALIMIDHDNNKINNQEAFLFIFE